MSLSLYWFAPSHGDGRAISRRNTTVSAQRAPHLTYLAQVAGAAEQLGFEGMLVPFGMFCEDPWLMSVALAQRTERIKFMIAFRPSLMSPVLAAQMAATGQRLTANRLQLNVPGVKTPGTSGNCSPGSTNAPPNTAAPCPAAAGSTSSPGTRPTKPGRWPGRCWPMSTQP